MDASMEWMAVTDVEACKHTHTHTHHQQLSVIRKIRNKHGFFNTAVVKTIRYKTAAAAAATAIRAATATTAIETATPTAAATTTW